MDELALLEQQVTLAEILDPDCLQRVCMTVARQFATGLAVLATLARSSTTNAPTWLA